eukprot:8117039-Alexandrium_andersonii.AAC.1
MSTPCAVLAARPLATPSARCAPTGGSQEVGLAPLQQPCEVLPLLAGCEQDPFLQGLVDVR